MYRLNRSSANAGSLLNSNQDVLQFNSAEGQEGQITFLELTIISPEVTRFFWPPLMPRTISLPTGVSAHRYRPSMRITYSVATLCLPPCGADWDQGVRSST